jgi:hypothetical protein
VVINSSDISGGGGGGGDVKQLSHLGMICFSFSIHVV